MIGDFGFILSVLCPKIFVALERLDDDQCLNVSLICIMALNIVPFLKASLIRRYLSVNLS